MQRPSHLYKYDSLSIQTLRNLKNRVIYFAPPAGFNDPYDCATRPQVSRPTDEQVIKYLRQISLAEHPDLQEAVGRFTPEEIEALRQRLISGALQALHKALENFSVRRGVSCFSERNDDLLMWSHYGGRYRGICLEFDTSKDPLALAQPVRYVSEVPTIPIEAVLDEEIDGTLLIENLFRTKSTSWQYECEWRAIHQVAGTSYSYDSDALTGVYFGPDIERECIEMVCLILLGQSQTVRFYEGRRSGEEFKVLFQEFTYISHLQAVERGLVPGSS